MDIDSVVKVVSLTASGVFAGYTWALSDATMPAILETPDEKVVSKQWRDVYLKGFYLARLNFFIQTTTFGYLAYHSPTTSLARRLYIIAAITTSCGSPYAVTFLKCTNGALSRRSDKLAGPGNGAIALTYAFNYHRSCTREKTWTTDALVRRWIWHNNIRTVAMVAGTFVGVLAMLVA